jgi:hypothetical protein
MGLLVVHSDESAAMSPNKSFQGTPKKLRFLSAPELRRYPDSGGEQDRGHGKEANQGVRPQRGSSC